MQKICKKCGIEKDLEDFHKDKHSKDGHRNICKECVHKKIYTHICEYCGKEYNTNKSKSKYCSISCSNKSRNHNNIKCSCDICGKPIEIVYSRYLKNKHNYCSSECQSKGKTLFYTGENNPLYRKSKVRFLGGKETERFLTYPT